MECLSVRSANVGNGVSSVMGRTAISAGSLPFHSSAREGAPPCSAPPSVLPLSGAWSCFVCRSNFCSGILDWYWVISKSPKLVQVGRVGNFFGPSGQGAFPSWSTWVTFLSQLSSAQWEGGSSERSPRSAPGGAFALHHLAAELEHRDSNMLWGDQTVAATPRRSSIRRSVKKLLD